MKTLSIHSELSTNNEIMKTFFNDCHNAEMEKNIGREIMFKKHDGTIGKLKHTIVCIQRDYKGELVYRVHLTSRIKKDFGRCADPDNIIFLPKKKAKK